MAVDKFKAGVRRSKNVAKRVYKDIEPLVEFVGDMVLNDSQKRVALRTRNQLARLDATIDRLTASSGAMVPHLAGPPVSVGTRISRVAPKFKSSGTGVTIAHREFVSYVELGSFTASSAGVVNPYNPYIFSWLSTIASSYDTYSFQKVIFEYIPQCATSTAGTVIIAWDPAASDFPPDFTSVQQMHSVTVAPWMPAKLTIGGSGVKYMGEQSAISGISRDMYNHGQLILATNGTGASGQLFVHYVVKLMNAQPTAGLATVMDLGLPASTVKTISFGNLDGFSIRTDGSTKLIVPTGIWKLDVGAAGTGITNVNTTVGSGCTATSSNDTYNTAATLGLNAMFLRSHGLITSTLEFKCTYTTLTNFQARLIRVDPASFLSSNVIV